MKSRRATSPLFYQSRDSERLSSATSVWNDGTFSGLTEKYLDSSALRISAIISYGSTLGSLIKRLQGVLVLSDFQCELVCEAMVIAFIVRSSQAT